MLAHRAVLARLSWRAVIGAKVFAFDPDQVTQKAVILLDQYLCFVKLVCSCRGLGWSKAADAAENAKIASCSVHASWTLVGGLTILVPSVDRA